MKRIRVLLVLLCTVWTTAQADCFDDAAAYHLVNPWILRAIAYQESSFKADTIHKNSNNTIDVGATGINSVHFPELRKFGIQPQDLLNPCNAIYVAGWLYRKKVLKFGNSWFAVGAFHSETPAENEKYQRSVQKTINTWRNQGLIPD
jgi:lysozyme-related protein Hpa2